MPLRMQRNIPQSEKWTEVLRAIKNEFLVYQTAKGAKPLDDAAEFTILRKMVKQRLDSRDQYIAAGRKDLADNESKEILVLESFLPSEASPEEQSMRLSQRRVGVTGPQIPKKCMGEAKLTNVDGKLLADTVKTYLV